MKGLLTYYTTQNLTLALHILVDFLIVYMEIGIACLSSNKFFCI